MARILTTRLRFFLGVVLGLSIVGLWGAFRPASSQSFCLAPVDGNVIYNPNFEDGTAGWQFFSNGAAGFGTTTANTDECSQSVEVSIQTSGSNVQLYQTGLTLQPETTYRLSLAARSSTGQDVKVFLQRHSAPYTSYGLNGVAFDLSADWQLFETEFTTTNFTSTVTDGRLRIWLAESNIAGESYYFDRVSLVPVSTTEPTASPPTASNTPTATTEPTSTATTEPTSTATTEPTSTPTTEPTSTTAPTSTPTPTQGQCTGAIIGNTVQNFGFEEGVTAWTFFSNGKATFATTTTNPYDCTRAAEVSIQTPGSNVQLYQTGLTLQPETTYRLNLAARSSTGRDVKVFLQRHSAPYTTYGLNGVAFDLSTGWQFFETEFTTANFTSTTSDSRLRIWLAESNIAGETYYFDRVSLVPVSATEATATPTHTATATSLPTSTSTATIAPTSTATTIPTSTATSTPISTATMASTSTATATTAPTSTATATPTSTTVPTNTPTPTQGQCAEPVIGNVLQNPGFEEGATAWTFFSNGKATFTTTTTNPYDCARAAEISIQTPGSNVQLYQAGLTLQPATTYRLNLAARSSTGRDVKVFLHRHTAPYTSYGLNGINLNLTPEWQTFSIEFTTSGFSSTVNNGRLRISLEESDIAGEEYDLDQISLIPIVFTPPLPTATSTPVGPTPAPTSTPDNPPPSNTEMVVFDWKKMVTTAHRGFPYDQPPMENGNWMTPINYAEGTFYYRAEVISMPTHKDMKLQFCIWQEKNGNNFALENCGSQQPMSYKGSKVVATWSQEVQKLWMKDGKIIEWDRPRYRNGVAIKTPSGLPVSDYNGWNWNGQNPNHWYPMNLHFTVVVVAKGHTFSGWENYP